MQEQLAQLEEMIDQLIGRMAKLQQQYQQLLEEKARWIDERTALKTQCDEAYERIETIIGRIQDSVSAGEKP